MVGFYFNAIHIFFNSKHLHEPHSAGNVSAAIGKAFWTGGFKHELNAMWAWCTKDSPEPIDDSMTTDIVGDVTTEKPKEGTKRVKVKNQDYNCLLASFEDATLSCNLCNAQDVYLGCESVEKLPADLLVSQREKRHTLIDNILCTAGQ
jgi:hypothetical protein